MQEFNRSLFQFGLSEGQDDTPAHSLRFFVNEQIQESVSKFNPISYNEIIGKVNSGEMYNVLFRKKIDSKGFSKHICVIQINEDEYIEILANKDRDYIGYQAYQMKILPQYPMKDYIGEKYIIQGRATIEFLPSTEGYKPIPEFMQLHLEVDELKPSPDTIDKEKEKKIWDKYVEAYKLLLKKKKQILKARVVGEERGFLKVEIMRESDEQKIEKALEEIHEKDFEVEFFEQKVLLKYKAYKEFNDARLERLQNQLTPLFIDIDYCENNLKATFELTKSSAEYRAELMVGLQEIIDGIGLSGTITTKGTCKDIKIEHIDNFLKILEVKFPMLGCKEFTQKLPFYKPVNEQSILKQLNEFIKGHKYVRDGFRARVDNNSNITMFVVQSFNAGIVRDIEEKLSGYKLNTTVAEFMVIAQKGDQIKDVSGFDRERNLYRCEIKHTSEFKRLFSVLKKEFPNSKVISRDSYFLFEYNTPPLDSGTLMELKLDLLSIIDPQSINEKANTIDLTFSSVSEYTEKVASITKALQKHKIKVFKGDTAYAELEIKSDPTNELDVIFNKLDNEIKNQDSIKQPSEINSYDSSVQIEYKFNDEVERDDIIQALESIREKYSEQLTLKLPNKNGETTIIMDKDLEKEKTLERQFYNSLRDADFKYETLADKEKYDELIKELHFVDDKINTIKKNKIGVPQEEWDELHKTSSKNYKKLKQRWKTDFGSFVFSRNKNGRYYIFVDPSGKVKPKQLKHKEIYLQPNFWGEEAIIGRMGIAMDKIIRPSKYTGFSVNPRIVNFLFDPSFAESISMPELSINSEEYQAFLNTRIEKNLNKKQEEAVIKALNARDLMLLQGPPGTGKTTAISEMLWQIICKNQKYKTLVSSQSNLAVDNALDRLPKVGAVRPLRIGGSRKKAYSTDPEGNRVFDPIKTIEKKIKYAERFEEGFKYSKVVLEIWQDETPGSDFEMDTNANIVNDWFSRIKENVSANQQTEPKFGKVLEEWKKKFIEPKQKIKRQFVDQYLEWVNIVAATCMECGTDEFSDEFKEGFNYVIVDEASKATPPELILPLTYGQTSIIIGDHKQLPPMIEERQIEEALEDVGAGELAKELGDDVFKISQFEKLFEQSKVMNPSIVTELDTQYRMHESIMAVINQFYGDLENSEGGTGLICGLDKSKMNLPFDYQYEDGSYEKASRAHGLEYGHLLSPDCHVIWVDVKSPETKRGTTYYNQGEIDAIGKILKSIKNAPEFQNFQNMWEDKEEDQEIGVITFYGAQLKEIRNFAKDRIRGKDGRMRNYYEGIPIRIDTVDRFQGMERNILIVSTVRSNMQQKEEQKGSLKPNRTLGFATDPKRINVAFSRARRLLIIVGNKDHFAKSPLYKEVINTINREGKILSDKLI